MKRWDITGERISLGKLEGWEERKGIEGVESFHRRDDHLCEYRGLEWEKE